MIKYQEILFPFPVPKYDIYNSEWVDPNISITAPTYKSFPQYLGKLTSHQKNFWGIHPPHHKKGQAKALILPIDSVPLSNHPLLLILYWIAGD